MKRILLILICLTNIICVQAQQDSIQARIILIGDGGELTTEQAAVMSAAAAHTIAGKTTVFFLGDNVYPRGVGLAGSPEESLTHKILDSQFKPFRQKGAGVYFLPGNHDWDKSGSSGFEKINNLTNYVRSQRDSLVQVAPASGCPGPVEIQLSEGLVVIAVDTEWWLYPYDIPRTGEGCDCHSAREMMIALEKLAYKNRYKTILLAAHHPLKTYGEHGGYFTFQDHVFPLTALNDKLWIPLPLIGSIYPVLRRTFPGAEDLRHPLYKEMTLAIEKIFHGFPNVAFVGGHEHALELINGEHLQIVSGGGSKHTYVKTGKKNELLSRSTRGYVTADYLLDRSIRFTFYSLPDDASTEKKIFTYDQRYKNVKEIEESVYKKITTDSVITSIRPDFNRVSRFHRKLLGENYRKEWATPVKMPVISISKIKGGLTAVKRGGGMQTNSLRLKDAKGKEWVLRSMTKNVDLLLPKPLQGTFASDLLDDEMTAQNPYGPLIVPVLASAAGIPHANPIIGIVAPEKELGIFSHTFAGQICLLEEREPIGKSDNTPDMLSALQKDNDNSYDHRAFLRARLLDLLIGDWDRHADQWRWVDVKKGKEKYYRAVPRDRDQAFYLNQGLLPAIASRSYILPTLQGFQGAIPRVRYSLFKTNFINPLFASQISYAEWMYVTKSFTASITDSVIDDAIRRLPNEIYDEGRKKLSQPLRERRDNIPQAMDAFYKFINKTVDIRASDKNEFIMISDRQKNGLWVTVQKISEKGNVKDTLVSKIFDPAITKEIRIYLSKGDDRVVVDAPNSPIKLRLIGGTGKKDYKLTDARRRVHLYDNPGATITDDNHRFSKKISVDSANTAFVPTNLYNITMPMLAGGYNIDDGVFLGGGFKFTNQGFRKLPYASLQELTVSHAFATKAYRIGYHGTWIKAIGSADFTLNAIARAPNNTQNFFGRGNDTERITNGSNWIRFYRTRFSVYQVDPALRWSNTTGTTFSIGPSLQYYRYEADDNTGRFINNVSQIGSYDSSTIAKSKMHLGITSNFTIDKRNSKILPAWGTYLNIAMLGYEGLNGYSKSFIQIIPEVAVHKSLTARSTVVISERIGGGVTFGKTTFYQSLFLGSQSNLLGFRRYRFAGQNMLYNNLEIRIKLADIGNYLLPGQLGVTGFYDIGRVWEPGEKSTTWHQAGGGGVYYAPVQLIVFQLVAGYSVEGWYPTFNMKFRY